MGGGPGGNGGSAVPGANVQREVVKVVKEDYAKQDLGGCISGIYVDV